MEIYVWNVEIEEPPTDRSFHYVKDLDGQWWCFVSPQHVVKVAEAYVQEIRKNATKLQTGSKMFTYIHNSFNSAYKG